MAGSLHAAPSWRVGGFGVWFSWSSLALKVQCSQGVSDVLANTMYKVFDYEVSYRWDAKLRRAQGPIESRATGPTKLSKFTCPLPVFPAS
jgi:hypothetical protein